MLKSNFSYVHSHKYTKIEINSDDDLRLEKAFTMQNLVILIIFGFYKNHSHNYYETFLEKCSYE